MSYEYDEDFPEDASNSRTDSFDGQEQKKLRYMQKYKKEWENDPKFREWLEPIQNDLHSAYCNVCCSSLTARKKDLMDHADTRKHKKNLIYKQNNPHLYQKMMQNIREVDANIIMDKSIPWQDDAIKCLIKQVEAHHEHFYDSNIKKSTLFAMIAGEMNNAGFPCVPSECQRKWESLRKSYERVLQYQVKGEFKSRFPYFNMIHRFLAKDIDPMGMRERMLAHKLGQPYDPNGPLILDGNLDGTMYTTTLITSKKDPPNVRINSNMTTTEITISSCDQDDLEEESNHVLGLSVGNIELEEIEAINSDSNLEDGEISVVGSGISVTEAASHVRLEGGGSGSDGDAVEEREWEEGAVEVLLTVMNQIEFNADMMKAKGQFHESFWEKVSAELLDYYCEVSAHECRYKWRQLLAQYKQLFQQQLATGRMPGSTGGAPFWQHYASVGHILEKIHHVKMPASLRFKRSLEDGRRNSSKRHPSSRGRGRGRGRGGTATRSPTTNLFSVRSGNSSSGVGINALTDAAGSSSSTSILNKARNARSSRKGIELALTAGMQGSMTKQHIKQERQDAEEEEEEEEEDEDGFINGDDGNAADENISLMRGIDDKSVMRGFLSVRRDAEPKTKMRRMQTSLLQVTQRIEMLERQVAQKSEDITRDTSTSCDRHSPQIVALLTAILSEMKKLNSTNKQTCCGHGCHQNAPSNVLTHSSGNNSSQMPNLSVLSGIIADPIGNINIKLSEGSNALATVRRSDDTNVGNQSFSNVSANNIGSSLSSNIRTTVGGGNNGNSTGTLKMAGDGKMHVSLADGTIAVQTDSYFNNA